MKKTIALAALLAACAHAQLQTYDNSENLGTVRAKVNAAILQTNTNTTNIAAIPAAYAAADTVVSNALASAVAGKVSQADGDLRWLYAAGTTNKTLIDAAIAAGGGGLAGTNAVMYFSASAFGTNFVAGLSWDATNKTFTVSEVAQ
jgi:hypothetical protein